MKHRSSKINMDCSNNRGSKGWNTIVKIVRVGRNGCFPFLSSPYLDPHLVTSSRGQTTSTHTSLLLTKERHLSLSMTSPQSTKGQTTQKMSFNSSGTIICKLQGTSRQALTWRPSRSIRTQTSLIPRLSLLGEPGNDAIETDHTKV